MIVRHCQYSVDILHEEPRGCKERNLDEKHDAKCVKLNNNHIEDVTGLMSILEQIILQPAAITWIDMSFNKLLKIHPVSEIHANIQSVHLLIVTQTDVLHEVVKYARFLV